MRDALPRASFAGFTGTPIELQDANTGAVFGDYGVYDIRRPAETAPSFPPTAKAASPGFIWTRGRGRA